jgi:hypothetical protein
MLSTELQRQIRAEEIYRHEIRHEISVQQKARPKKDRLWSLLNSALVLWFLSSVVLAALTAAVATYQKYREEQIQRRAEKDRVAAEIINRLTECDAALSLDNSRLGNGQFFPPSSIYADALAYLDNHFESYGPSTYDFSIYPEYQHRRFLSLLASLRATIDSSAKTPLQQAESDFHKLVQLADEASVRETAATGSSPGATPSSTDKTSALTAIQKSRDIMTRLRDNPTWAIP